MNFNENLKNIVVNEVETIKKLHHPYIISIADFIPEETIVVKSNGQTYKTILTIVEEFAEGGELFDYIAYGGYFKEEFARFFFKQLIRGLEYMHSQGIVHRDLKPDNILLDRNFNLKIADFGFAAPLKGRFGSGFLETVLGTNPYMAPEIHENKQYKGTETDLFASAIVLFTMVSGSAPF